MKMLRACALIALLTHASATPGVRAETQTERVPDSAVVNGVPQGIFVGRSLLTGRAVCLLFLGGGRVTRAIPGGGLEAFDWARHRAAHGPDSGSWQMRGGQLVVSWGDGGVHQGPITVHPDGIEFYGKRYSKPAPVSVAAIAGRWEAARGTAIAGGAGINRVSELTIFPDGRYQWGSTTGGMVSGRAVATERSTSGSVSVKGLTIILRSDTGVATSHTFVPVAGTPVNAFSVDADMFTRVGPAPAVSPAPAAASSSAPAPATSHQGLFFTMPSGWTSRMQQGRFMLTPGNTTPDAVVIVLLSGAEKIAGQSLDDWLRAKMAADLSGGLKPLQSSPPTPGRLGSLQTLAAGRTIQDASGSVLLQVYQAITDGQQAGLAMAATASEAAMKTHLTGTQTIFQSLRFGATPDAAATSSAAARPATSGATKSTITAADLVGAWSHASSTYTSYSNSTGGSSGSSSIAYGQGYDFSGDGSYTYRFTGMRDRVMIRESDSGSWGFQAGNLVLRSRERNSTKTYQIVQYQTAADGMVSMILLDAYYQRTDSNINVWGEKFVRKPPK